MIEDDDGVLVMVPVQSKVRWRWGTIRHGDKVLYPSRLMLWVLEGASWRSRAADAPGRQGPASLLSHVRSIIQDVESP